MASASRKSFLLPLRNALTYLAGISLGSCPSVLSRRLRRWAPTQASMPTRQGGRLTSWASSCVRDSQAQNDGAAFVETDEVEGVLADVDAENGDGVFGMARHGGLLVPGHPPDYCGEHRRSIPLGEEPA